MKKQNFPINSQPLVINWHLTEACNYQCQYCYAKWNKDNRELIHNQLDRTKLLKQVYQFFSPGNQENPLAKNMSWDMVRLNLAGGEPLLYPSEFLSIVKEANSLGFLVSLITNGSQLDRETLNLLAPYLCWIGVSLDSSFPETNKAIGRSSREGDVLDIYQLAQDIHEVRQTFPTLGLKINTVVNSLNYQEHFGDLINLFRPEKWKVLQMLPLVDKGLIVSREQFQGFLERHVTHADVIYPEYNDDMTESYLMIDPYGRFYQNSQHPELGYCYSRKILNVGTEAAFSEMQFDSERFCKRYECEQNGEAA